MERAEETGAEGSDESPVVPKLAFCLAATSGRHTGTDWSRTYVAYKDSARRLTPEECEGLQGFPPGWTIPYNVKGSEEDLDSLRYKALGNAVSVPVAEWLGNRLAESVTRQSLVKRRAEKCQMEMLSFPGFSSVE